RLVERETQAGIHRGIAAVAGSDGDLTNDLRPQRTALGVLPVLAMLDVGPFGMAGHGAFVPGRGSRRCGCWGAASLSPANQHKACSSRHRGALSTLGARNTPARFPLSRELTMAEPLVVAKTGDTELAMLPALANRHGCITGATGTGKTVTLQVL